MMKYVRIYILFTMSVFCDSSKGQNKTNLPTDTIKAETKDLISSHGPNTMVRNIKKDRNGTILIASTADVFRYDGKSFTNLTSKLGSSRFWNVLRDRHGNLWITTIDSGVYYYNGKSFRNFTTIDGLASNQVSNLYEDKTGNIWFSTQSGASRYDGKSFQNYKMNEQSPDSNVWVHDHNDVNSIIEDKKGKFWFGTRGNACLYDGKTFAILSHDGKRFRNVRCIIEDKKGNMWLGGYDGLWRYDGSTFTQLTNNFTGYIYEDKNGNIWTSSQSASDETWMLSRFDEKSLLDKKPTVTEIKSQYEGNKGMLFGILEADDGSIWFGAFDGVHRYDGKTVTDLR